MFIGVNATVLPVIEDNFKLSDLRPILDMVAKRIADDLLSGADEAKDINAQGEAGCNKKPTPSNSSVDEENGA